MGQEQLAGMILCILGLVLLAKPMLVWRLTESWKTAGSSAPSDGYLRLLRIVSAAAICVGVLLLAGIVK